MAAFYANRSIPCLGDDSYLKSGGTYTHIEYTWYGMIIYISHEDVQDVQNGGFVLSFLLADMARTGIPQIDALLRSGMYISFFVGIGLSYYDRGNGVAIICPLYIPSYIYGL